MVVMVLKIIAEVAPGTAAVFGKTFRRIG